MSSMISSPNRSPSNKSWLERAGVSSALSSGLLDAAAMGEEDSSAAADTQSVYMSMMMISVK